MSRELANANVRVSQQNAEKSCFFLVCLLEVTLTSVFSHSKEEIIYGGLANVMLAGV